MRRKVQDTNHYLDEFANFPWHLIKPEECTKEWTFRKGGYGFPDEVCYIVIFRDDIDCSSDNWELPPHFGEMFLIIEKCAIDKTKREIRDALGI